MLFKAIVLEKLKNSSSINLSTDRLSVNWLVDNRGGGGGGAVLQFYLHLVGLASVGADG